MTDYITLYHLDKEEYAEIRQSSVEWSIEPDVFYHNENMIYHAMRKWIIELIPTEVNQVMLFKTIENLVCVPTVVRGDETVVDFTNSFPVKSVLIEHGMNL